jgi:hypothetical protein
MKNDEKSKLVEKALNKFPTHSSWGIGRILKQDNPLVFKDVETARDLVRMYRGLLKGDKKSNIDKKRYEQ